MNRYKELVKSFSYEPKDREILCSFLFTIPGPTLTSLPVTPTKNKKKIVLTKKLESRDVMQVFSANQRNQRQKDASLL